MRWFRLVSLATLVLGIALASQASANPISVHVTYNGTDKAVPGMGTYVGPYSLTVTGFNAGQPIQAACYTHYKLLQSEWDAWLIRGDELPGPTPLSSYSPVENYQKAAYLYTLFGKTSKSEWDDLHLALWSMFWNETLTSGAQDFVSQANAHYTEIATKDFWVIVPQDQTQSWWGGKPQAFITTPEPASLGLILMGSGLSAVIRRRRRRKA